MKVVSRGALLFLVLIAGASTCSADSLPVGQPDPWVSYRTPSTEHAKLERFVGTWNTRISIWLSPDAAPETFDLKAETAMTLGGRFHRTEVRGFMQGALYEEIAWLGFDNITRRFTRTVAHTMGTGLLVLDGDWNAQHDTIDLHGETKNPATLSLIKVRQRLTFIDLDTMLLENFEQVADGAETKTMEQRFTRTKR